MLDSKVPKSEDIDEEDDDVPGKTLLYKFINSLAFCAHLLDVTVLYLIINVMQVLPDHSTVCVLEDITSDSLTAPV